MGCSRQQDKRQDRPRRLVVRLSQPGSNDRQELSNLPWVQSCGWVQESGYSVRPTSMIVSLPPVTSKT